jgi:hypothetical protein
MRKLLALMVMGLSTLFVAPAMAADMPYYPDIEVPDVDYGLEGSFYLRGSVAGNFAWARDFNVTCGCAVGPYPFQIAGYGYSYGAGLGYEFGDGLRSDVTFDYFDNSGLKGNIGTSGSTSTYRIRGGVALANVYYDFGLGGGGSAEGGFGAYVGGGLGLAAYEVADIGTAPDPTGTGVTGAAAAMVGVSYDMGSAVADLGYRALYLPHVGNYSISDPVNIRDTLIHELRGTVRYRFN